MSETATRITGKEEITDEEIVARVMAGETFLFEIIMRRYNQRLYRASRAILRDDAQAEDVVQDAYVRAYQHLAQFAGKAMFSTWLTRIAIHEALARANRLKRFQELESMPDDNGDRMDRFTSPTPDPESQASNSETRVLLERWIEALPHSYRTVLILRDVEEMSTTETAEALGITEENVKTRLHRARALLRRQFYHHAHAATRQAFPLHAPRCDRIVANVFQRLKRCQASNNSQTPVH